MVTHRTCVGIGPLTEADGFFCISWNIDFIQPSQPCVWIRLLNEVRDIRVVCTATAHIQFVNVLSRRSEPLVVLADCLCRDPRQCCHNIVLVAAGSLDFLDQLQGLLVTKNLSTCRLWDIVLVPPVVVNVVVDNVLVYLALLAPLSVSVIFLLAIGIVTHGMVDEDISRTGIKIIDLINATISITRDKSDITNPADVLARSKLGRVMEHETVEECNQGCSLTTVGLFVDSKVIDDSLVEHLGHDRTFRHGQSRLHLLTTRHGQQPDGLAVSGDHIDVVKCQIVVLQHADDGVGKIDAQCHVDLSHFFWSGLVLSNQAEDPLLDGVVVLHFFILLLVS